LIKIIFLFLAVSAYKKVTTNQGEWRGEEWDDTGVIVVNNNEVTT